MSGWLFLGLLFAASLGALWLLRLRGAMLQFAAAALLFGCAGYAVQGHPLLKGAPKAAGADVPPIPLTDMRHAFFGRFSAEESWISISEGLARTGDTENSVGVLQNAIGKYPNDPQLWIALGNALVDHAGVLTPASEFAYQRAAELNPGHPAPAFFMGLALARSGDGPDAVAMWKQILSTAPSDAGWRPMVEAAVKALDAPKG